MSNPDMSDVWTMGEWATKMVPVAFKIDPVKTGREDCDDAIASDADAAVLAQALEGADEALINAMNRSWVLIEAAGADPSKDQDEEWERVGRPWCAAYNAAFRERAAEIAAGQA